MKLYRVSYTREGEICVWASGLNEAAVKVQARLPRGARVESVEAVDGSGFAQYDTEEEPQA